MYKIIDNQGGGLKKTEVHKDLKSVVDSLANFHDNDFEGVKDNGEYYKDIYEFLDTLKDDFSRLDFLMSHGDWSVECVHGVEVFTTCQECVNNIIN